MKTPSHEKEIQAMALEDATSKVTQANEMIMKLEEQLRFAN